MIRIALLQLTLFFGINTFGQSLALGLNIFTNIAKSNQQFETKNTAFSLNGGALILAYKQPYKATNFNYDLGMEFSFTDWGTQILSRVGASTSINKVFNEALGVDVFLLNGIALYVDKPAYVFGVAANVSYIISIKNKKRIKLNAGLRYSQNNTYKAVGNFRFIDLPVGISCLF